MNEMILRECNDENILKYASNAYNSGNTLPPEKTVLFDDILNDTGETGSIECGFLKKIAADMDMDASEFDIDLGISYVGCSGGF